MFLKKKTAHLFSECTLFGIHPKIRAISSTHFISKNISIFSKKDWGQFPRIPLYHINNEVLKNPNVALFFGVPGGTSLCLPQEKGTSPKSTTTGRRNDKGDPDADGNLARKRTFGAKGPRSEMTFLSGMEKEEPKRWCVKFAV